VDSSASDGRLLPDVSGRRVDRALGTLMYPNIRWLPAPLSSFYALSAASLYPILTSALRLPHLPSYEGQETGRRLDDQPGTICLYLRWATVLGISPLNLLPIPPHVKKTRARLLSSLCETSSSGLRVPRRSTASAGLRSSDTQKKKKKKKKPSLPGRGPVDTTDASRDIGERLKVGDGLLDNGRYSVAAGCVRESAMDASSALCHLRRRSSSIRGSRIASFQLVQELIGRMVRQARRRRMSGLAAAETCTLLARVSPNRDLDREGSRDLGRCRCANAAIQLSMDAPSCLTTTPSISTLRDARVTTL